jgi:hypothetical protein
MKARIALNALLAGVVLTATASAADWITAPSYYSHDPQTGQRVTQYTPIGPVYTWARPDFLRSGYRHTRSTIQAGHSADHMHIVEEWGRAIRPYGEWRFPYRPYSVPYALWGPPFAGMGVPGFFAPNAVPFGAPNAGGVPNPYRRQQPPPYYDGSYPSYRSQPRVPPIPGRRPHRGDRPARPPSGSNVPAPSSDAPGSYR